MVTELSIKLRGNLEENAMLSVAWAWKWIFNTNMNLREAWIKFYLITHEMHVTVSSLISSNSL